jgi:N-acetylglutamate synthase-like GNAT family acetyltransferase
LYAQNEPGRFPPGVNKQYEESLKRSSSYFLVAENDGQIFASGGLSYYVRKNIAILCFGLVHPSQQGKGIGTALLLARLALLKPSRSDCHVFIFAVEKSIGFYRRFGFRDFQAWEDPQGAQRPSGHLRITASEIRRCRALLKDQNVIVPEDEAQIPLCTQEG